MYRPPTDSRSNASSSSQPSDAKYYNFPLEEFDDDIRESVLQQKQSRLLSRIVGLTVILSVVGAIATGFVFYAAHNKHSGGMHSSPTLPPTPFPTVLATCGTNITCPAPTSTEAKYNPVTGFTNFTGWYDGLGDDLCCNLCSETTHREGYFSVDADEGADIVFAPGEFDYLIFDQIWLPQWCAALQEGHDPTLSHPVGTLCVPSVEIPANNKLSIHGVWPSDYNGAFLSCCSASVTGHVPTINPLTLAAWEHYPTLLTEWMDPTSCLYAKVNDSLSNELISSSFDGSSLESIPTTLDVSCGSCFLHNHEWQKHGSCFATGVSAPFLFFETGLNLSAKVTDINTQVQGLAGQSVLLSSLTDLYAPYSVQILCDPQSSFTGDRSAGFELSTASSTSSASSPVSAEGIQVLVEVRTCWLANATQIDCPATVDSAFTVACQAGPVYLRAFS